MQILYEAIEQVPSHGIEPEIPCIDVTGYSEAVCEQVRLDLIDIMAGRTYILRKHYHYHKEHRPCETELL